MRSASHRRGRRIILVSAVVTAGCAPAAAAATPFTAGYGDNPAVAVGADGSGHVVWLDSSDDNTRVAYCRVAAAADSCNRTELLTFGGATGARSAGRPLVFAPAAEKIVVIAHCRQCGGGTQNRTYRWVSTDNGASFGTPVHAGNLQPEGSFGYGTWLDEAGVFVGVTSGHARAMQSPSDPPGSVRYASGGSFYHGSEIARVPGTQKLVAVVNDLGEVRYGVYTGASAAPADINNAATWIVNRMLPEPESSNSSTALSSAANGVFLSYLSSFAGGSRIGIRRFDPASDSFGAPVYVGGEGIDRGPGDPDSFQDPAGRVHLAWRSLHDGGRLRYAVSDTAAATFSPPANLATHETFSEPELAAGTDGRGFATWTNGAWGNVRIVPLDPRPEPAPASAPGTPPPPQASPPPPASSPPPAAYSGPHRITTVRVPGGSISLRAPRGCVAPGQTYRVTLRWKRQKRKGRVVVKIRRTDFYVGRRRAGVDKRAPFARTLRVDTAARRGSTVTLRARAFIKVKRGKSPTKSIRVTIRICA